jgi:hypothetical protein
MCHNAASAPVNPPCPLHLDLPESLCAVVAWMALEPHPLALIFQSVVRLESVYVFEGECRQYVRWKLELSDGFLHLRELTFGGDASNVDPKHLDYFARELGPAGATVLVDPSRVPARPQRESRLPDHRWGVQQPRAGRRSIHAPWGFMKPR